jgi:hypothetical protein
MSTADTGTVPADLGRRLGLGDGANHRLSQLPMAAQVDLADDQTAGALLEFCQCRLASRQAYRGLVSVSRLGSIDRQA